MAEKLNFEGKWLVRGGVSLVVYKDRDGGLYYSPEYSSVVWDNNGCAYTNEGLPIPNLDLMERLSKTFKYERI